MGVYGIDGDSGEMSLMTKIQQASKRGEDIIHIFKRRSIESVSFDDSRLRSKKCCKYSLESLQQVGHNDIFHCLCSLPCERPY